MNSILISGIFFVSSKHRADAFIRSHAFWWFFNHGNGIPTRSPSKWPLTSGKWR